MNAASPRAGNQPDLPQPVWPVSPVLRPPAPGPEGLRIGGWQLGGRALVAPMAGVTDRPYRQLCKRLGAAYAVSEMAASNPRVRDSVKTTRRIDHGGEMEPRSVQIAGADPAQMAEAARFNVDRGAQIIDINMGCPARKVCQVAAGSALMANERLALEIIDRVANAVSVPVTVKMRTGPHPALRNAPVLARAAEAAGAALIVVHGRTRACRFSGAVEYDTIASVKAALQIPVVANGDIGSPEQARAVLQATGADAVMVGRAGQGRPWLYRHIDHFLTHGTRLPPPSMADLLDLLQAHLIDHYAFYGPDTGARTARKHIGWYLDGLVSCGLPEAIAHAVRAGFNASTDPDQQLRLLEPLRALTGLPLPGRTSLS